MSLRELLSHLDTHRKSLVIERSLSSSINSLIPFSVLKLQADIQNVYWFDDALNIVLDTPVTFLIKSTLTNAPLLQRRVRELQSLNPTISIDLVVTDDYPKSFEFELDKLGVLGDITAIQRWKLYLESRDLITLHSEQLQSIYLYKTPDSTFKLASLLNRHLQQNPQLRITKILSKGLNSSKFVQSLRNLKENDINQMDMETKREYLRIEQGLYEQLSSGKQCDLIVLERNLDFMSVLLNQVSYLGIIDEVFGIDINTVQLDETIYLNGDEVYHDLKDMNFGVACDYLNTQAKTLQQKYDGLTKTRDVSQKFVEELQKLEDKRKYVSMHTQLSESIILKLQINEDPAFNELLELQHNILLQNLSYSNTISKVIDLIYQSSDVTTVLRLLGITSIVFNGLRERDFQNLSQEIIETYGVKYLLKLQDLIKIGVITIRGDPSIIKNFAQLSNSLQLVPATMEQDMSYRGYIPLVTRILEHTIAPEKRSSWSNLDLSELMGKLIDESLIKDTPGGVIQKDSTVFIVMIGGITYSEMASIKHFEDQFYQQHGVRKTVVVITEGLINAKALLA